MDLLNIGIKPAFPVSPPLQVDSLPAELSGKSPSLRSDCKYLEKIIMSSLLYFLFFWLRWVFAVAYGLFIAVCKLYLIEACGLSCSVACGILVPQVGIEPVFSALEGPLDHEGRSCLLFFETSLMTSTKPCHNSCLQLHQAHKKQGWILTAPRTQMNTAQGDSSESSQKTRRPKPYHE